MLFNSIEYFLFLPVVFIVYWLLRKQLKLQHIFLLLASYFFYACWDYRFLSLIILSSITDYIIGLKMGSAVTEREKKVLLGISLLVNLGILFVFKY